MKKKKSNDLNKNSDSSLVIEDAEYSGSIYLKNVHGNIKKAGMGCRLNSADFHGEVIIGNYVSVWGPNIRILSRGNPITIGSFSSIAMNTMIINYNHKTDRATTWFVMQNIFEGTMDEDIRPAGKIVIEEDVWVGANSIILGGVTIGRGSIIAAGSVVNNDVPPYSVAGGVPAKFIKKRFSDESIKILEESKWWTWETEKIKNNKEFFLRKFE
jgi:virginiamycin A acetyltransferase